MLRTRRSAVLLCLAVAVFAAFAPTVSVDLWAVLTPVWLPVPAEPRVLASGEGERSSEQPVSLRSLLPSRAPPAAA